MVLEKRNIRQRIIPKGLEPSTLVDHGQQFYDLHLKARLEPERIGKYLAIEPESGKYFIDDDGTKVMIEALQAMPGYEFYLMRIGFAGADAIGGYGQRNR